MKLKFKTFINVKPDKNGEYPEAVARRLIASGVAIEDKKENRKSK
jgi:hypothetical protein